jgi:hypothetical protein
MVPRGAHRPSEALVADELDGGVVDLDLGEHLLVADPAARVGVGDLDELVHRVGAVADDVGGHALGDGLHPAPDDEAAVVPAGDEGLDDDVPATDSSRRW